MAAIFDGVVIGGQDGKPFPNYAVSTESVLSEDESIIGVKQTIKITGQIIAIGDMEVESGGSSINVGVRQDNLHEQINVFLDLARSGIQSGRLEIDPYGGLPNKIEFKSAKLMSVEIPDQDEESAGVLYANYTFTFEAYDNDNFDYSILSAEESWELNTDETTTYSPDVSGSVYKVYTVTHTVSAKGRKKFDETGIVVDGDAWKQAELFVRTRLVNSPVSVSGSLFGPDSTNFNVTDIDGGPDLSADSYGYYNHIRIPQCSIGAGTYSVTDTWTASKEPVVIDMENTQETDNNGVVSITVSGSITGLTTDRASSNTFDKITAAETALSYIDANAYNIANLSYSAPDCSSDLLNLVQAKSIGRNKGTGIITFSYSFNNIPIPAALIDGGVPVTSSYALSISDDNEDGENNVIAIIPIILKADGPIIQDMGTTTEKKRTLQLDLTMNRCNRTSKPSDRVSSIVTANKPTATNTYRESKSEQWSPVDGTYSLNITWVY